VQRLLLLLVLQDTILLSLSDGKPQRVAQLLLRQFCFLLQEAAVAPFWTFWGPPTSQLPFGTLYKLKETFIAIKPNKKEKGRGQKEFIIKTFANHCI